MIKEKEIRELIEVYNEPEIADARDYYYNYLQEGDREETFALHLKKYGRHAKVGDPVDPSDVERYQRVIGIDVPVELKEFYTIFGSLSISDYIIIPPLDYILDRIERPEKFNAYDRMPTSGLIDFIVHSWGGSRQELQPHRGEESMISRDEAQTLNKNYPVFGYYRNGEWGLEDSNFIYFDRAGKFGTVYYHQDLPGDLEEKYLRPMLEKSPARKNLSEILIGALEGAIAHVKEQGEEED